MALLDGKWVAPELIDPAKHKFIGTFRSPYVPGREPNAPRVDAYHCPCGSTLWTIQDNHLHWQQGHFDQPQYITILQEEK